MPAGRVWPEAIKAGLQGSLRRDLEPKGLVQQSPGRSDVSFVAQPWVNSPHRQALKGRCSHAVDWPRAFNCGALSGLGLYTLLPRAALRLPWALLYEPVGLRRWIALKGSELRLLHSSPCEELRTGLLANALRGKKSNRHKIRSLTKTLSISVMSLTPCGA